MKLHIKRVAGILSIALILSVVAGLSPIALAEDGWAIVSTSNARIYANQDLSGKSAKLPKYAILTLISEQGGIAKVECRGYTGYISASSIEVVDTSAAVEAVFVVDGRVYEHTSTASKSAKVAKGTKVNVYLAANGCALVEKDGIIGYTRTKYLTAVGDDKKSETPDINYDEFQAIVTDSSLKVYASAKTKADVLGKLPKDTVVTVTAYTDKWARIDYNSRDGYCLVSGLAKYVKPEPTARDIFGDDDLSNEEKIFYFLRYEMDYNAAGACGVLANIKAESGFRPTAYNPSGGSYGICQWLGGRKTALQNYCAANGYDYTTLEGQLWYMKYELENKYTSTFNYLKGVDDSAQGAYDAGYYWCYYYEIPASRASSSVKRGNIAKDEFWPEYR